ncbi:MAG TPA: RNA polymerase sigma factor [Terriglobia bacterium]|nr:RNA polymerase sigma factor [Terriglobia bacterium]
MLSYGEFLTGYRRQLEACYAASRASQWSVGFEDFAHAVWAGVAKCATDDPGQIPKLLDSIHAEDLALALGCAQGSEPAWNTFLSHDRALLYQAAYAFAGEESQSKELADSLIAELYGVDSREGAKQSKFAYFHGRSSLATWLRSVLYHKFVNEYRRTSRLEPLPEGPSETIAPNRAVSEGDEARYAKCLAEALEAALGGLTPADKLLLGYYYVQGLTLKQIGLLTGDHEATVSRHLAAVTRKLRKRIENHLRRVERLSAHEVERCLDFASRGVTVDLARVLKPG